MADYNVEDFGPFPDLTFSLAFGHTTSKNPNVSNTVLQLCLRMKDPKTKKWVPYEPGAEAVLDAPRKVVIARALFAIPVGQCPKVGELVYLADHGRLGGRISSGFRFVYRGERERHDGTGT